MDCLFCRIVSGDIPAAMVVETERTVAFRDLNAIAPTHVLVVPRVHINHAAEITADYGTELAEMMTTAQEVARIDGIADRGFRLVFNVGQDSGNSVNHLHMHVIGGRTMGWPPFSSVLA